MRIGVECLDWKSGRNRYHENNLGKGMEPFLEHINMTSTDIEATVTFLQTAMPELQIRGGGEGVECKRWVHVGTESSYLSIEDRGANKKGPHRPYIHPGLNHIGFVVPDSDSLAERMRKAGYQEGNHVLEHPFRKRYYFFDHDDNEYEFVEYLSNDKVERNDYTQ